MMFNSRIDGKLDEFRGVVYCINGLILTFPDTGRSAEVIEFRLFKFLKWHGSKTIQGLGQDWAEEYRKQRKAEEVTEITIESEIRTFNYLLRFVRDRGLAENPPIKPREKSAPERKYVSRAVFEKFLGFLKNPHARLYFMFQRYMGLGKNEVAKLKHQWLDESREILSIYCEEWKKAARKLKIPKAILQAYRATPRLSEWVCPSPRDPERAMVKPVVMVARAFDLAEVAPFHRDDLRYSFSQDLAEKGVSGPVRKAILGLSTTLEDDEKEARQKAMDEAMDLVSG